MTSHPVPASGPATRDAAAGRTGDLATRPRNLQRLLDAGESLMLEIGSFDFGVRDVVERAGMSLRSFYQYFDARDDFVLAIYAELIDRFARTIASSMPKGGRAVRFRHYVFSMVVPAMWGPTHRAPRSGAAARESFRLREVRPEGFRTAVRPLREILEAILGTGRPALTRDADTVLDSLLTEVYAITIDRRVDAEAVAEHLYRYHCRALGLRRARR